jgi:hypothetical protein
MTKRFLMVLSVAALLLAGCGGQTTPTLTDSQQTAVYQTLTAMASENATDTATPAPSPTPTPEPTATPEPSTSVGPDQFPAGVNPLTGLAVSDAEILDRRPVLIKVSNFPVEGRPHSGLSFADIVFEYYIGAGSNRFAALYYGQDCTQVNPVRSVRRVDGQLARLYQAVLGYSGGNEENVLPVIYELLPGRTLAEGLCPGICDDGHHWVTTVYGDSAALTRYFKSTGADTGAEDLTGMRFDEKVPEGGQPGDDAWVKYTDYTMSEWVYDPTSGKYLRWTEDPTQGYIMIPLVDRITGEQLAFSNVIVLNTYVTEYTTVLHDMTLRDNQEGQTATIFRDGQAFEVTWKASDPDKPLQFFDAQGQVFPLKPGNTWMALIGITSDVATEAGEWVFNFRIP